MRKEQKPLAIHSRPCCVKPARSTRRVYMCLKRITVKNMSKSRQMKKRT